MNPSVHPISLLDLAWISVPVAVVFAVYLRWSMSVRSLLHGFARMFVQLMVIGYALAWIFGARGPIVVLAVLCVMLTAAGLIALRPLKAKRPYLYLRALLAISGGSLLTLTVVVRGVIALDPWFEPRYLIPLAGMIFANSMNAVSIGAERFESELSREGSYLKARAAAFRASLIPITNSLFAVGLVSLPGMMTGQILSGVSPLVAARYQIMVMCMVFSAAGMSSALYLRLMRRERS